jgi:DNA-binding response OmpR family regulator
MANAVPGAALQRTKERTLKRILVVDDEVDITDAIDSGLTRHGFTVDTYNDPMAALNHFKSKKNVDYDIVLLDIRMPKMNGFELCKEMMKVDSQPSYCFMTAFDVYKSEFKKIFPGSVVKAFLKKPVSATQLVQRLDEVMNKAN